MRHRSSKGHWVSSNHSNHSDTSLVEQHITFWCQICINSMSVTAHVLKEEKSYIAIDRYGPAAAQKATDLKLESAVMLLWWSSNKVFQLFNIHQHLKPGQRLTSAAFKMTAWMMWTLTTLLVSTFQRSTYQSSWLCIWLFLKKAQHYEKSCCNLGVRLLAKFVNEDEHGTIGTRSHRQLKTARKFLMIGGGLLWPAVFGENWKEEK